MIRRFLGLDAVGRSLMPTPDHVTDLELPEVDVYPSPEDWHDEMIYFIVVDRFSDGKEDEREKYDRKGVEFEDWAAWSLSGQRRYQGGTIKGAMSKLPYLKKLGMTTLWISPLAKQRVKLDTYHGYSAQDFMDVESRLGTMDELAELIKCAHEMDMRVILDVVFNHSGCNWLYSTDDQSPEFSADKKRGFGGWLSADEKLIDKIERRDDGVWPKELQDPNLYYRAGTGDLGEGEILDPLAENKRSDFFELRAFDHRSKNCLDYLIKVFQYWISATNCDGFRLDTLKHVTIDTARTFCNAIKEHAQKIGKDNFLVIGEVAGGDHYQEAAQQTIGDALDATLDIGEARVQLTELGLGNKKPEQYFDLLDSDGPMAKYRHIGKHVTVLDDHDLVATVTGSERLRFAARTDKQERVLVSLAVQMYGPGIPCIYYGTEQAMSGPDKSKLELLEGWGTEDHYLRETMFGAEHPRQKGMDGHGIDKEAPGFAAFGALGRHIFDEDFWLYKCVAAMNAVRKGWDVFRRGSYLRSEFLVPRDDVIAFSRLLNGNEAFVIINFSMEVQEDAELWVHIEPDRTNVTCIFNLEQTLKETRNGEEDPKVKFPVGEQVNIHTKDDGKFYFVLPALPSGQVLIYYCEAVKIE